MNNPLASLLRKVPHTRYVKLDSHLSGSRPDRSFIGFHQDCRRGGGDCQGPVHYLSGFISRVIDRGACALTFVTGRLIFMPCRWDRRGGQWQPGLALAMILIVTASQASETNSTSSV